MSLLSMFYCLFTTTAANTSCRVVVATAAAVDGGCAEKKGRGGECVVIVLVVVCYRCFVVVCSPPRSSLDRGQRGATRPGAATHRYLGREVLVLARPAELGHDRDVERVLHEVAARPPARLERARDGLRPHRHHGDAVAVAHAVRDRARDRRRDRRAWRSAGGAAAARVHDRELSGSRRVTTRRSNHRFFS